MTISGIRFSSWNYENIQKINGKNIQSNQETLKKQQTVANEAVSSAVKAPKILATEQLEDFVFDFKKNKEFSMIGEESDIKNLDLTKTIADTKKDDLLDQYRYFVGEGNSPVQYASLDGVVTRVVR